MKGASLRPRWQAARRVRRLVLEHLESRYALTGPIDTFDRVEVVNAYRDRYVPAYETPLTWTGSTATCDAGNVNQEATDATLELVNYFRNMTGLEDVTFDPGLNTKAQEAALMMQAQNSLSHYPDANWACYSEDGSSAAGHSNLFLGVTGPKAIPGYIEDPGDNNTPVGHRRWILFPRTETMGTGSTSRANALWVITSFVNKPAPEWTSWPPAGYVTKDLVYPRWSLSHARADFSQATVTMTNDGRTLDVEQYEVRDGYGLNTLVWSPYNVSVGAFGVDGHFTVTVDNVLVDGKAQSFQYQVTSIDPQLPQLSVQMASSSMSEASREHADFVTITRQFADTSAALKVTLASDDSSEAVVISSVTIPAGQSSVKVSLLAVNDPIVDGAQQVNISASATGFTTAIASIIVEDNDTQNRPWLWTNHENPVDTNGDGVVTPLDVLIVVNYLNLSIRPILAETDTIPEAFYDVDENYLVTPLDALIIINYLNRQANQLSPNDLALAAEGEEESRCERSGKLFWSVR